MDGTLHQVQPFPPQRRFAEVCATAGIMLSEDQALAVARARRRFLAGRGDRLAPVTEQSRHDYTAAGLRDAGLTGDLDELADAVIRAFRQQQDRLALALDPDVPAVLEALRDRGVLLGVISNWESDLTAKLTSYGIDQYFTCVMTTAIAGVRKTAPGIYVAAYRGLGLDPAECLHVGDSPSDDVIVPQALGVRPVVYDPLECVDCDCPRISRLMEVLSLLS